MTTKTIDNKIFYHAGDGGLIIDFSAHDTAVAIVKARQLGQIIRQDSNDKFKGVRDAIPGLNNLLIQYDPLVTSSAVLKAKVEGLLPQLSPDGDGASRLWVIPVCYGGVHGPDLNEVAEATGLTADDVINRHIARTLTVAIVGFLPGLGYMKGIDEKLYLPRRSTPRKHVPGNSVGIAMDQTVIYPLSSPGGWNLLGQTPVRLFDPKRAKPVLLAAGDQVRFTAIDEDKFIDLDQAAAAGEVIITPEEEGV